MKNIKKLFFVAALVLGITQVFAQKDFKEGFVNYKMAISKEDPQAGELSIEMNIGILRKDAQVKTTILMDMMGMMMSVENTLNTGNKTGLLAMDMMGQKIAAKITSADYEKVIGAKAKMEIAKVEDVEGTETILGHKCKKAKATTTDGQVMDVYYTKDFKSFKVPGSSNLSILGAVDGLVLKFVMKSDDADITMEATELNTDKVADSEFTYDIPAGYTEMTYDQLSSMSGGGM